MSGHGRGLLDSLVGLHDLQFNPQKKGKRVVAFTNRQCPDFVYGHETLTLQKQHRLTALYLFDPTSQELRRERFKHGHGASSARRGRGRGTPAVTHSQSTSGRRAPGKKAKPGKGKSGSSLEPIRGKSATDLGRNIGSSRSRSPFPPRAPPPPRPSAAVPDWVTLPSKREVGEERPVNRAARHRKRQKLTLPSHHPLE